MQSLCMAEIDFEKSIAFPAIGTGNLDFPKDEVAKVMMGQVLTFAEQVYKGSKLDVCFVLYPPDQDTVKVMCLCGFCQKYLICSYLNAIL